MDKIKTLRKSLSSTGGTKRLPRFRKGAHCLKRSSRIPCLSLLIGEIGQRRTGTHPRLTPDLIKREKMSSLERGPEGSSENGVPRLERAVTDSVHERFRRRYIRCEACNCVLPGSPNSIRRHFVDSHPSKDRCLYCNEKVFTYVQIIQAESGSKEEVIVYHKCPRSQTDTVEDGPS